MNLAKISKTAAFKDISDLVSKKIVVSKGGGRGAYYVLCEGFSKDRKRIA